MAMHTDVLLLAAVCGLLCVNGIVWFRFFSLKSDNRDLANARQTELDRAAAFYRQAGRTYSTDLPVKKVFFRSGTEALQNMDTGLCALAAFDGDHFSELNKRFGAGVADIMQQRIADCLKAQFPENENNLLCNVSAKSDEFILLLQRRPSRESILRELEDLRANISAVAYEHRGEPVKISVSIGVAFATERGMDIRELYERACAAQAAAKANGGNTVTQWQMEGISA